MANPTDPTTRDFGASAIAPQPDPSWLVSEGDQKQPSLAERRHVAQGMLQGRLGSVQSTGDQIADQPDSASPKKLLSKDDRVGTTTSPHSVGQTRNTTINWIPGVQSDGPHIPVYCESILDTILHRFGFRRQLTEPDQFEEFLRSKDEITLADVYHTLSEKPAWKFKNLFSWKILGEASFSHTSKNEPEVTPAYDGTLSDLFGRTRTELLATGPETVRLCCIVMTSPDLKKLFTVLGMFASSAYPDPKFWSRTLCAYMLFFCGHIERPYTDAVIKSKLLEEQRPMILHDFRLPSQTPVFDPFTTMGNGGGLSLDVFVFTWAYRPQPFSVTRYHTTIPYKHEPRLDKIEYSLQQKPDGAYNVTLLFKSERLLHGFNATFRTTSAMLRAESMYLPSITYSNALHVFQIVFAIHKQMNQDLSEFLGDVHRRARYMVVECREHPGRSEYLYMTVLEDNVLASLHHLKLAEERLQKLDLTEAPEPFQVMQISLLKDTTFLSEALQTTAAYLRTCQEHIKTYTDMKQSQTAGIMSLLVAVYVPLAGVASYLGMNTVGIANGDISTSTFWEAAIPLTVATIFLPLSATVLARLTLAATFSTRVFTLRKWPLIVDWCIILLIVAIVVTHLVHWRIATDTYFIHYFSPVSPLEGVITGSIFAAFQAFKAAEHVFQRNSRAKKWFWLFTSNLVVCVVCAALSPIDPTPATVVTPTCYIILVSLVIRPIFF